MSEDDRSYLDVLDQTREILTNQDRIITETTISKSDLLSSGSTLLNLACTGCIEGAFAKGKYTFIVGDSQSGKTFITRTALAEATINPNFKGYRLIYDDVEDGALMDTARYFGEALENRLEAPAYDENKDPVYSKTIEDFYYYLDDLLSEGRPLIYILDSMDSLSSESEGEKFQEQKKAYRKGKKVPGSYGDGKAKKNSSGIRSILSKLRDTGSILLIINQTRDNIGAGPFEPQKSRSGGHALTFYATSEIWFSVGGQIKITVKGKARKVGIQARARIKKNRFTGRERTIEIPIYYSTGIDDVGSNVDYLVEEERWKKAGGGYIEATELDLRRQREDLIQEIEARGLEGEVRRLVKETWDEIEQACAVKRKSRYG